MIKQSGQWLRWPGYTSDWCEWGPDCNGTISRQGDRLMLGEERKEHTITDWEIQFQLDPNFEIIRFPEGLVREAGI